jgi:hypothetical protein
VQSRVDFRASPAEARARREEGRTASSPPECARPRPPHRKRARAWDHDDLIGGTVAVDASTIEHHEARGEQRSEVEIVQDGNYGRAAVGRDLAAAITSS